MSPISVPVDLTPGQCLTHSVKDTAVWGQPSSPLLTLRGSSENIVRTYYSEQCVVRAACSAAQQDKGHMIYFVIKANNFQMSQS